MARHYGGTINPGSVPGSSVAPGSFNSREVTRQRQLNVWPVDTSDFPSASAGDYLFAASSGTVDLAVASAIPVLIPSGQAVSRSTYSDLFSAIGTTYGVGDGSTTFNLPDLVSSYQYLKTTTTSGATLAQLSGVAKIPSHTHSVTGVVSINTTPTSCLSAGGNNRNVSPVTTYTGFRGSPDGNNGRHRQVIPLIAYSDVSVPVGFIVPFLQPQNDQIVASGIPSNFAVLSGQTVSTTDYADLFSNLYYLYGSGADDTTFKLPDLRGIFVKNVKETQVSGILPSGYILDDFAQHHHSASLYSTSVSNDCNGPTSYRNQLTAPATGASSVGTSNENRPNNISVVYTMRLE